MAARKRSLEFERLVLRLKHRKGVKNPFALANFILKSRKRTARKKRKGVKISNESA